MYRCSGTMVLTDRRYSLYCLHDESSSILLSGSLHSLHEADGRDCLKSIPESVVIPSPLGRFIRQCSFTSSHVENDLPFSAGAWIALDTSVLRSQDGCRRCAVFASGIEASSVEGWKRQFHFFGG